MTSAAGGVPALNLAEVQQTSEALRMLRIAGASSSRRPSSARRLLPTSYFNSKLEAEKAHTPPVDIFGGMIGRVVPPDEKMKPGGRRPSPRVARSRAAAPTRPWEGVEVRQSRTEAHVVLQPELADFANPKGDMHQHAKHMTLERIPSLVRGVAEATALELVGSTEMPEARPQQFGQPVDALAGLPTPRFKSPVTIPPRQNAQANPDGILPPNSSRHDMRTSLDKHYSVRQEFPLRKDAHKPQPPQNPEKGRTPRSARKPVDDQDDQRDVIDIEYKDYGAAPTLPAELSRKAVKKVIRSKLHWGRYEQVGRQQFLERPKPNLIAVAESRHANPDKDYNKLIKAEIQEEGYSVKRLHRIAHVAKKEKEKSKTVQERRTVLEREREQWKLSVAGKYDEEIQRQQALAKERRRRQLMWLSAQAHCTAVQAFSVLLQMGRFKSQQTVESHVSSITIQQFIRSKFLLRKQRLLMQQYREMIDRIRPFAYFFIVRWRSRRKAKMANRLRQFLLELLKTNQVKRRISYYIHQVRRLQVSWRHHLRRQKARMLVLSRQWDRAIVLLRSKGKHGKLHDVNELPVRKRRSDAAQAAVVPGGVLTPHPPATVSEQSRTPRHPKKPKDSHNHGHEPPEEKHLKEGERKRVAFEGGARNKLAIDVSNANGHKALPGPTPYNHQTPGTAHASVSASSKSTTMHPNSAGRRHQQYLGSAWDHKMFEHNSVHVTMTSKQLSLLSRIVHYPVIKWQRLRHVVRTKRKQHIQDIHRYMHEIEQYRSFADQKRNVEQVIIAFAPDEEGGREMAKKLLGDMVGTEEPAQPRLTALVSGAEMQRFIAEGLERLVHSSGQLREEAKEADARLRSSMSPDLAEQAGTYSALANLHHYKPWWICHETIWHTFHVDPHA
jgi:hypothetical protein